MDVDALTERAVRSHNPRPLMQGLSRDELHRKIKQQLIERESTYLRAHIILDGSPDIEIGHLSEAINFRNLDRDNWGRR